MQKQNKVFSCREVFRSAKDIKPIQRMIILPSKDMSKCLMEYFWFVFLFARKFLILVGQMIQLRHVQSKKFLTVSINESAKLERDCFHDIEASTRLENP